jgi:hypothetical protein
VEDYSARVKDEPGFERKRGTTQRELGSNVGAEVMKNKIVITAIALSAGALMVSAQDEGGRPPGPRGGGPLLEALDANKDGKLDAAEIANAAAALKTLDKNGDGILTQEELRPNRPGGPGGRGERPGRPPGANQ